MNAIRIADLLLIYLLATSHGTQPRAEARRQKDLGRMLCSVLAVK
jgi:hypothetical protein